ncbi:MarR family transcriptional regulator [Aestuariicella hydrocarbonica]|uniref:MarR family transcriptional regulator n=1 Tax=Pseudomaricurvus hydrocarbonicus TaxID=1470433 RepID=A0A9E5MNS0_9GAMM|nr:MarR family transcriptional regulator [Aestuariicella hydrocarbonica]NHO67656.1 MarR family transcriptional regulator [Aestuariicella hydrocarbonica]
MVPPKSADNETAASAALIEDILNLKVENPNGPYQLEGYRLSQSVGYLLKRSFNMLSGAIDKQLLPYDLTHPQFAILMLLSEQSCSTAANLARESSGDTGAITRMIDRLEAKALIRRERSTEDRRVINIVLTDFGKLVVEKMPVIAINVLNDHLQHFDADEITTLKRLLNKLLDQPQASAGCNTADHDSADIDSAGHKEST